MHKYSFIDCKWLIDLVPTDLFWFLESNNNQIQNYLPKNRTPENDLSTVFFPPNKLCIVQINSLNTTQKIKELLQWGQDYTFSIEDRGCISSGEDRGEDIAKHLPNENWWVWGTTVYWAISGFKIRPSLNNSYLFLLLGNSLLLFPSPMVLPYLLVVGFTFLLCLFPVQAGL